MGTFLTAKPLAFCASGFRYMRGNADTSATRRCTHKAPCFHGALDINAPRALWFILLMRFDRPVWPITDAAPVGCFFHWSHAFDKTKRLCKILIDYPVV